MNKPQLKRQERAFILKGKGYNVKQIAEELIVSTRTVYRYTNGETKKKKRND